MKVFLAIGLLLAVFASTQAVLQCYTCNSEEDSACIDNPTQKQDCGRMIADLSADRFRCMTIHGKEGEDEVVLRRCSVNNECKYQLENGKFSYGKIYNTARCEECVGDYCNDSKLL